MKKEIDVKEFNKLKKLLTDSKIPFEENSENIGGFTFDGFARIRYQLCYPNKKNRLSDVIISWMSYGRENGLLEQMGLLPNGSDDVEGWLTADVVFERWKADWESRNGYRGK